MNVKRLFTLGVIPLLLPIVCLSALPPSRLEELQTSMRQIKMTLSDLKHEVNNHENEIRIFEAKLQNQDSNLESLRQEWNERVQSQNQSTRAYTLQIESKLEATDQMINGMITDMRQIKTQANDSVETLSKYQQKFLGLEKILTIQEQHIKALESDIKTLESALQSIVEALQSKGTSERSFEKTYEGYRIHKVQAGDTLEKIARTYHVSLQALRDLNQLNQDRNPDRIYVGQTLKIP